MREDDMRGSLDPLKDALASRYTIERELGRGGIASLVYEVTRRGVSAMPTYEYRCEKCRKRFSRVGTISQHGKRPQCPKCGSVKVMQVFSSFFAKTGKKS